MDTLTIGGVKTPFTFNINSLRNFSKSVGIAGPSEIESFFKDMNFKNPKWEALETIATLIECAIREACRISKIEAPDISVDDILLEFEKNPEIASKVINSYIGDAVIEDDGKK